MLAFLFVLLSTSKSIASDATAPDNVAGEHTVANPGITLTVSTDKTEYTSDDPIYVFMTLKNQSASTLEYGFKDWNDPSHITVTRKSPTKGDVDVEMTAYSRLIQEIHTLGYGNGMGTEIPPGYQEEECFVLNRERDLTLSGNYSVTLRDSARISGSTGPWLQLSSNTQRFSIRDSNRLPPGAVSEQQTKIETPAK